MRTIRVAITADTFLDPTTVINQVRAPFAPRQLMEVLALEGAVPVVLPDVDGAKGEEYVDLFDALVLPGGQNTAPRFYGEEPLWCIGRTCDKRDIFEMEMYRAAKAAGKPILGICRGLQLINVAEGGTLYQDLQTQNPDAYIQHAQETPGEVATHSVTMEKGSALYRVFGEKALVNSRHHEAVKDLGKGLKVTAKSPDGVIEGIESADGSEQIIAVQWHPENMWPAHEEMRRFFQDFLGHVQK